jgi:hypothetical protein
MRDEDDRPVGELYLEAGGNPVGVGLLREELDAELERRPRRQTLTEEFLREVAQVYRDALAQGVSTQTAIQRRWPTSAANARRWIAKARGERLLGPAPSPRVAGERRQEEADG